MTDLFLRCGSYIFIKLAIYFLILAEKEICKWTYNKLLPPFFSKKSNKSPETDS